MGRPETASQRFRVSAARPQTLPALCPPPGYSPTCPVPAWPPPRPPGPPRTGLLRPPRSWPCSSSGRPRPPCPFRPWCAARAVLGWGGRERENSEGEEGEKTHGATHAPAQPPPSLSLPSTLLTLGDGRLVRGGLLVHLDDARVVFQPHAAVLAVVVGAPPCGGRELVDLCGWEGGGRGARSARACPWGVRGG